MTPAELKKRLSLQDYFLQHGSSADARGRWRCLCPERHNNGDANHSVTIKNGIAWCWSQKCFGDQGADIFGVVGMVEHLSDFQSQKERVMELARCTPNVGRTCRAVRRAYRWEDAAGHVAFKIRWETELSSEEKYAWARDQHASQLGKGPCQPTLRHLDKLRMAATVQLCEGEKDEETLNGWNHELKFVDSVATTTPNGASDVKPTMLEPLHGKVKVYLSGDNDEAGRGYVRRCGEALLTRVCELRLLTVPDGFKDWSEWKQSGATAEDFKRLLENAPLYHSGSHSEEVSSGTFHPISVPQLLDEPERERPWIWEDFLPEGALGALVAKPKVGKSTIAYELAVKIAQGQPFLGRITKKGPVLILALEEHRREVKQRLFSLGAAPLSNIHVHIGPLADSADMVNELKIYIVEHGITLVIFDTLNSFWRVKDENDAVGVTRAITPILSLARDSNAAVLLVHHARKSEGDYGDEIRGSGALFSLLDVAVVIKRHEVETQRKLTAISRYPETPADLIIERREHGHEALGSSVEAGRSAKMARLQAELTDTPESVETLAERAAISKGAAYPLLDSLVAQNRATRMGAGKRSDPYRYSHFVPVSSLRDGCHNETKGSTTVNDPELFSSDGFVSLGGTTLRRETKERQTKEEELVSFRGDGGHTKHNGTEENQNCEEEVFRVD